MIKVSVIIPVYNVEKYLRQCLDSLINQTLGDIEIICVNDGSTDNSLEILCEYEKKDKRFIVIDKENTNAGDTRNQGLKIAKGEYIGFMDSDDWIDSDYYELLYNKAKETDADMVRTSYKRELATGESEIEQKLLDILTNREEKNEFLGKNEHTTTIWNALYNHKFLKDNNIFFDSVRHSNDMLFSAKATLLSKKIAPLACAKYHYRFSQAVALSNLTERKLWTTLNTTFKTADFINSIKLEKEDYLVAYKKLIWRLDDNCKRACREKWFKNEKKYFNELCKIFDMCKYPQELNEKYYEKYFNFLDSKDYNGYRKFRQFRNKPFIEYIFSIQTQQAKNNKIYNVITILGLKIKIKKNK